MVSFIDVDEVLGLGEKFDYLAHLFRRFNFPNKPHPEGSSIERDYWDGVLRLYSLNSDQLDYVAQETLDEWNLQIAMGQDEERSDAFYLNQFTRRLNAAIDEITEEILPEFSASQLALTQTEEEEQGTRLEDYILTPVQAETFIELFLFLLRSTDLRYFRVKPTTQPTVRHQIRQCLLWRD